jgi:WD40 repeat protein
VASGDGETVRLWDARTAKETGNFQAQNGGGTNLPAIWGLAFSPDGKTLAAGGNDGTVRLRDLANNREQARLPQGFPVGALAFSSDGARLASAGFGGTVKVWNAATGAKLAELDLKVQRIHQIAFQPGRGRLAITGARVILWDLPAAAGGPNLKD